MDYEDIINELTNRYLNDKTNNLIVIGDYSSDIIDNIPNECLINNNRVAKNIKIDLSNIEVNNIFQYILNNYNINDNKNILFNNLLDLIKFQNVLSRNNIYSQLILYNMDLISKEEQMLINELYYFYSDNFNITSFVKDEFSTYFLNNGRVLDDRENFQKYKINNHVYKKSSTNSRV